MEVSRQLRDWVRSQAATLPCGTLLPSDHSLAGDFGLSRSTVRRVMRRLETESVVTRLQGKGTVTGRPSDRGTAPVRIRDTAAERIAGALKKSIGRGEFREGKPLPLCKNLCATFRSSPNTVVKALDLLVCEGHISRRGRHYVAGGLHGSALYTVSPHVMCLFPRRTDLHRLFTVHDFSLCLHKMETELIRGSVRLKYGTLEELPAMAARWLRCGRGPVGMLWGGAEVTVDTTALIEPALGALRSLRRANAAPRVCILSTSVHTDDPGVIYFSMSHSQTIMRRRIAAYAQARHAAAVTVFLSRHDLGSGHLIDAIRLIPEIDHVLPGMHPRFVIRFGSLVPQREALLEQLDAYISRKDIDARLSKYRPMKFDSREQDFTGTRDFARFFTATGPLPALWVFDDDRDAAAALAACRAKRYRVPRDIAIISVDNDPAHYALGISACVRDWETMGYLIAHAVLGDIPLQFTSRGFVDYDVLFIERGTT